MSSMWSLRWLWVYLLIGQFAISNVRTAWPASNSTNIQLLGIFGNGLNMNDSSPGTLWSRAMFNAAILLSQQYNITIDGQFIGSQLVASGGITMNALSSSCLLISTSNIVGIVGPTFSRETQVIAPFAAQLSIPVVSYSATDPGLSDRGAYPTFYRTVPSDTTAALTIAQLFMKLNWTSSIIIYQNDAYGSDGAKVITNAFNNNNLTITQMIMFDTVTHTIRGDLKSLLFSSPIRNVILWAETDYTSLILQEAIDCDVLGPQFTWILGSTVQLNSFSQADNAKLIGILTIEPVVASAVNEPTNTTLLNAAYDIWQQYEPETFPGAENVNAYALFTFDATWLLIRSLEQLCSITNNHSSPCLSIVNDSFCFNRRLLDSSLLFDIINTDTFLGVSGLVQFSSNSTDRVSGIYYVVKNVQSLSNELNYVPVLVWSSSDAWTPHSQQNTIIWPGQSLVAPTGYATIAGVILRIAVIEAPPFTMTQQVADTNGIITTKLVGYIPDLLAILQTNMGFIPNITLLPANQSYDGLIDDVANHVYDMVAGDVTILAERREQVSFTDSIYDNSLRIIVRNTASASPDFWFYLRPFSLEVRLCILGSIILSAILTYLFERNANDVLRHKSFLSKIVMSIWYPLGTIMGFGVDYSVRTGAGRFLTFSIFFLSLVLISTYQATLTSNLTLRQTQNIISGIDDIKNGKIPYGRIGIVTNSSIEAYYLQEISNGIRNFYPLRTEQAIFTSLLSKVIDAAIMDEGVLEYETSSNYCNLTLVGTGFDPSAFGIVFQKNWVYEQVLDVNILSLRESGTINNLKSKWFQSNTCSQSSDISTGSSIEVMGGLFVTFAVMCGLSLIFFIWLKLPIRRRLSQMVVNLRYRICPLARTSSDIQLDVQRPSDVIDV
ncbi:unnamed protein product [Adineta steineri]|uniref:Ionotropic glutamate receptor C-terminal domain-containing protein n=1 Tax=Adineta steineri TaxID=433720 RepID=A0A818VE87_9BILA|nr:unnamed protein product [Adineta steineri]CAF3707602.1 unnamed protein product [Adineta steineri]